MDSRFIILLSDDTIGSKNSCACLLLHAWKHLTGIIIFWREAKYTLGDNKLPLGTMCF